MHLICRKDHSVRIGSTAFKFRAGEMILTECSYKYTFERFESMANRAGFRAIQTWTDPETKFCVQFLGCER
jgi:uncharacterized SAM-dependent methyltransferase